MFDLPVANALGMCTFAADKWPEQATQCITKNLLTVQNMCLPRGPQAPGAHLQVLSEERAGRPPAGIVAHDGIVDCVRAPVLSPHWDAAHTGERTHLRVCANHLSPCCVWRVDRSSSLQGPGHLMLESRCICMPASTGPPAIPSTGHGMTRRPKAASPWIRVPRLQICHTDHLPYRSS